MKKVVILMATALALTISTQVGAEGGVDPVPTAVLEHGKELFMTKAVPACAICHTLADADATGAIGPDLDELKPDLSRVKKALQEGMGTMPSFSASMSDEDMDAVAQYVVHATGGAK